MFHDVDYGSRSTHKFIVHLIVNCFHSLTHSLFRFISFNIHEGQFFATNQIIITRDNLIGFDSYARAHTHEFWFKADNESFTNFPIDQLKIDKYGCFFCFAAIHVGIAHTNRNNTKTVYSLDLERNIGRKWSNHHKYFFMITSHTLTLARAHTFTHLHLPIVYTYQNS